MLSCLLFIVGLLVGGLPSWAQTLDSDAYEPHEILISYRPISPAAQAVSGSTLLKEHQEFVKAFQQQFRLSVVHSDPVFHTVVERMVNENLSEFELLTRYQEQYQSRKGSSSSGMLDRREFNFCRTLCIRLNQAEIGPLVQELSKRASLLRSHGFEITSMSPSSVRRLSAEPNDPWFSSQYAHSLTGAVAAWERQQGDDDIVIGVIDTGIDPTHEDLAENLLSGRDFVNWFDLESWQIVEGEDYLDVDNEPADSDGHGTAVSGVIAAQQNNAIGISGVCPQCKIRPMRAFARLFLEEENDGVIDTIPDTRGPDRFVADAILWAIDQGVDVLNFSFGNEGGISSALLNAIELASELGILLVGSAGNENSSVELYPAANDKVIAVASTDENDERSSFSNYGTWIDIAAPGSRIFTTFPTESRFEGIGFAEMSYEEGGSPTFNAQPLVFSGLTPQSPLTALVEYVGKALEEDIDNSDYDWDLMGKIALIERGEITFKEKVDRVRSFGAAGAIIFNNEAGNFGGTLQEAQSDPIPVVSISQAEGSSLLQTWTREQSLRIRLRVEEIRGYTIINGTSFAAPYVAGMAGLILSEKPLATPKEIKDLLQASADNINLQNPDFIGQLGAGRVSLANLFSPGGPLFQREENALQMLIYPNPTQDVLQVANVSEAELSLLRIVNNLGEEMYRLEDPNLLQRFSMVIDISNLPRGTYVLLGDGENGQEVHRFSKISP